MKPFNLNEALAGHPVVTRDGQKVTQLHLFDVSRSSYCLYGVLDGEVFSFTKQGTFNYTNDPHECDLFMESTRTKKWINVYKDICSGELFVGQKIYNSEQDARNNVWNDMDYFNTIEIEI